jgi:hypothetical protein
VNRADATIESCRQGVALQGRWQGLMEQISTQRCRPWQPCKTGVLKVQFITSPRIYFQYPVATVPLLMRAASASIYSCGILEDACWMMYLKFYLSYHLQSTSYPVATVLLLIRACFNCYLFHRNSRGCVYFSTHEIDSFIVGGYRVDFGGVNYDTILFMCVRILP